MASDGTAKWPAQKHSNVWFNVITVISWILFTLFLCTQPYLANWANNTWAEYNSVRTTYEIEGKTFVTTKYKTHYGLCSTPMSDMVCTDGQNFTELALKWRPKHLFGCGCGEGILGESLCPRTSYGFTLSDYVSTAPALGAMLGLATFPLIGVRELMESIIENYIRDDDGARAPAKFLYGSLYSFQINFILWGIASVCVFPTAHSLLTVTFLGSFVVYALTVLYIFNQTSRALDLPQRVLIVGAVLSFFAITLGAIPRVFLMIDSAFDMPQFPDLNSGYGSYAFWLGEVIGLSVFFGLYPLVFLAKLFTGTAQWDEIHFKKPGAYSPME